METKITKDTERKALEQIRKIVAGLGEDSYLATAFEGCFEDAEYNIRDDAAYSMKSRWDLAKKERDNAQMKLEEMEKKCQHLEKKIAESDSQYKETFNWGNKYAMEALDLKAKLEAATANREEATRKMQEVIDRLEAEKDQMAVEIMKLKAKLYDLMMK